MRVESLRMELVPLWKRPRCSYEDFKAVCELRHGWFSPYAEYTRPFILDFSLQAWNTLWLFMSHLIWWHSVREVQVDSTLILVSWLSFMGALRSSFPFSCPFWCRWTDVCKLRVLLTLQEESGVRHVSQSSNLLSLRRAQNHTVVFKTVGL